MRRLSDNLRVIICARDKFDMDVPPSVGMKIPAGTLIPKVTMVKAPLTKRATKIALMTGIA